MHAPGTRHSVLAGLNVVLVLLLAGHGAWGQESPDESQQPSLTGMVVSSGRLSPEFSPGRHAYVVHVASTVASLTVTITGTTPGAVVTVGARSVTLGAPSEPVPVSIGRTLVPVDVEAGGRRVTYILKILRKLPVPTWTQVRDAAPFLPRDSAGELVFNGRMWLLGGYTPALTADVWSSVDGFEWTQAGALPNEAGVNLPINLVYQDRMWVVCNDGRLYASPDGREWGLVSEHAPWAGRYGAGGAVFNGRMWVLGGMRRGDLYNDVWSSSDGVTWTLEVERAPWARRQLFGLVAVFQGKLWVIGGGITSYHPFKAYRDVWNTSDGRNWTRVTDAAPWPERIWSTVAVYRNRLWLLGGFQSEPTWTNLSDVWYSTDGQDWTRLEAEHTWSPRHELSAFVHADALWVVAGNAWPLKNDVWRLSIPGLSFVTQPAIEDYATTEYTYRAQADFGAAGVRYRLLEAPSWMTVDVKTGVVRGTPPEPGDYPVTLEAGDVEGASTTQNFTLHILPLR